MEEKEIMDNLELVLRSKNLTDFERLQIEDALESIKERSKNPILAEDLPEDNRKQHYHSPYRRKIEGR